MRGDIVFRVYGMHAGRDEDSHFGAFRTEAEARAHIDVLKARELYGGNWAKQYHNRGFEVRPFALDTDFEVPPRPAPRERYCVKASRTSDPDRWTTLRVDVFERVADGLRAVCAYDRNHTMFQTFEPFRQAGRDYALISRDYMRTAVLDLASGVVVAEETDDRRGFCPVGFYVPDWWDVHDGSSTPGSEYWNATKEWPTGRFGFVWGCVWGDDTSWKVQYLDLARIAQGIVARDDRFGYVELATTGYASPCLSTDTPGPGHAVRPPFISVSNDDGRLGVQLAVEMTFDLVSGKAGEWQRLAIDDEE